MQLSVSTIPVDPSLAAFFAGPGRPNATEAGTAIEGGGGGVALAFGFAELLSGAASSPSAPTPAVADSPAAGTAAAVAGLIPAPLAAANFSSWFGTNLAPGASGDAAAVELPVELPAAAPGKISSLPDQAKILPIDAPDESLCGTGETTGETPVPATQGDARHPVSPAKYGVSLKTKTEPRLPAVGLSLPDSAENVTSAITPAPSTAKPISPGKSDRTKSPSSSASRSSNARELATAPAVAESTVLPMPVAPVAVIAATPEGDAPTESPSGQPGEDSEDENGKENLPAAISPVTSRKGAKSFASPSRDLPESGEPDEAAPAFAAEVSSDGERASTRQEGATFLEAADATSRWTSPSPSSDRPANARVSAARPVFSTRSVPTPETVTKPEPVLTVATPATPLKSASEPAGAREAARLPVSTEEIFPTETSATPVAEAPSAPAASDAGERASSPSVTSPAMRFENATARRPEIFAAFDGNFPTAKNSLPASSDKTFLTAAAKRVTTHDQSLGIGVAKSEAVMPAATLSERPTFVAPVERASVAAVEPPVASSAHVPASAPLIAHRAVDAVMTAVERFSSGDRHAVQLQFSVGGADLSVRVEMRGDEVRTTFRTDSPELRSALSHEWQAATPDSADRSVRIAAPVFASSDSTGSGFSGDTARQRDARTRRGEAEEFFSSVASRPGAAAVSAVGSLAAPAARARVADTALHLSTHA